MIAKLYPHPEQVTFHARLALNGFEDLEQSAAVENAQHHLRALIAYVDALSRADDPVLIHGIEAVKPGVLLEFRGR